MLEHVQYSSQPSPVSRMLRPDGAAEFRLTQNVNTHNDEEGNTVIEADEVFFVIEAGQTIPSVEAVENDFDAYWESGIAWPAPVPDPPTVEELQEMVNEQDQQISMLTECLLEMSEIVYGE